MDVAVIGPGMWAKVFILPNLLQTPDVQVRALVGRDASRTSEVATMFGIEHAYDSLGALLDDGVAEAVFVLTPPSSHRRIAEQVAAAGLPVFCEKPLGMDEGETQSMVNATAAVPTAVGFTMRFHPTMRTLAALVHAGELGEVRHIQIVYSNGSGSGDTGWARDGAEYPYGVLSDLGPHAIDLCRWLGGDIAVVSGTTRAGNFDEFGLQAELVSGAMATIVCSRLLPASVVSHSVVEVTGTSGIARVGPDRLGEIHVADGSGERRVCADALAGLPTTNSPLEELMQIMGITGATMTTEVVAHLGGQAEEMDGFPTFLDGHRAQQVQDAAVRAIADRRWTRVGSI